MGRGLQPGAVSSAWSGLFLPAPLLLLGFKHTWVLRAQKSNRPSWHLAEPTNKKTANGFI